jgi:4-amino-4-deoxy-L-arabinose transferase-like glycosyltransferase
MSGQMDGTKPETRNPHPRVSWLPLIAFITIILLGLGLRFLDLTDPPLDFHAWRQLRSATIARGMYYSMSSQVMDEEAETAISLGKTFEKLEPEIFERIVALTYLVMGKEYLPVARIWAIVFWLVGGVFLYDLSRRLFSPSSALITIAYYMTLPFAVTSSRSFLPDIPMTMWLILSTYALYRWSEEHSWIWTILAGVFSGIAILTKVFAVFPVFFVASLVVLTSWGIKAALRNPQVWAVGAISVLLPTSYYLVQTLDRAGGYLQDWVFAFAHLLITVSFYIRWLSVLDGLFGFPFIILGLIGVLITGKRARVVLLGLWLGYLFVGLSVPSLILSHTYYNTLLIPIVALSLAPIADLIVIRMTDRSLPLKGLLALIGLCAMGYLAVISRNDLLSVNYREEVKGWVKMGRELPKNASMIGITHDYNTRLRYYGLQYVALWPNVTDYEMQILAGGNYDPTDESIITEFERRTKGFDYFIVTNFAELNSQPVLKSILNDRYSTIMGEGYVLYDLREYK